LSNAVQQIGLQAGRHVAQRKRREVGAFERGSFVTDHAPARARLPLFHHSFFLMTPHGARMRDEHILGVVDAQHAWPVLSCLGFEAKWIALAINGVGAVNAVGHVQTSPVYSPRAG
jgi:hypothetical protein